MASARIGALRVDLSMDSAQFASGLRTAESGLSRFSKVSGIALAAVAAAAATAATAIGFALKGAADHADQLSKTSQKIGITVESLSRLEYAGRLADVSLETLSTGLRKLSQNLFEVSEGRGSQAASSFAALGVSVTDANGKLRNSDDILTEVADKFSRLEDGSTKTALAMNLFGRSGAELIPLLNSGADGLKRMADESDHFGQTISTKTAQASERFNDALTKVESALGGLANTLLEAATPALVAFADWIDSPEFQLGVAQLAVHVRNLGDAFGWLAKQLGPVLQLKGNIVGGLGGVLGSKPSGGSSVNLTSGADLDLALGGSTPNFDPIVTSLGKVSESFQDTISWSDKFHKAVAQSAVLSGKSYMSFGDTVASSLGTVTGALASAFSDNKEIQLANAGVNIAAGIASALGQGPFGWISAAAIAAAGAIQIGTILSSNIGSSPSVPSVPSAPAASIAAAAAPSVPNVTVEFTGSGLVSRKDIESLVRDINSALRDGVRLGI